MWFFGIWNKFNFLKSYLYDLLVFQSREYKGIHPACPE